MRAETAIAVGEEERDKLKRVLSRIAMKHADVARGIADGEEGAEGERRNRAETAIAVGAIIC